MRLACGTLNAMQRMRYFLSIVLLCSLFGTLLAQWNSPHRSGLSGKTRYSAFTAAPKTLDPARAYSSNEIEILAQIYEPIMQYHYLKRPYQLEPLTASTMPKVTVTKDQGRVTSTLYTVSIKPGILYQPHPAFAKNAQGQYRYLHLKPSQIDQMQLLADFKQTGTVELTAADYVYAIKRLASPRVNSPIASIMAKHISGFADFQKALRQASKQAGAFLDLRRFDIAGVKQLDRYHYQIRIKGSYPQFQFWLSMIFFSPTPWQVDAFYSQPGMKQHNISWDWYPVGTGPYMLVENNPNQRMILERNPNFRQAFYPDSGELLDVEKGLLQNAGKQLPMIDRLVMSLDKESIPRWNKFLQGYYDASGIGAESFDSAVQLDSQGNPVLSEELKKKGLRLTTTVLPSWFYMGFNMLDPVVGGYSAKQRDLRQAIAIAINYEQYINVFLNGRGIIAHGPIPPGISGYESGKAGINPYVYDWKGGKAQRKSIEEAKQLLTKAGYPNGVNSKTGKPLMLHFDVMGSGSPDDQAYYQWMRKQLAKLGIQLSVRSTHYSRFQDKMRKGAAQMFTWGWNADYPDPENFLFLLYGPNGKVKFGGENPTNYNSTVVNPLFEQISQMPDSAERAHKIQQVLNIIRKDSPVIFGYYPIQFSLNHSWNSASKPHGIANNTLKYQDINTNLRAMKRTQWNAPIYWPIALVVIAILILLLPLIIGYWFKEKHPRVQRYKESSCWPT